MYDIPDGTSHQADIIRDHLVNKENIRPPIIKNSPDSDRTQCSKPPLYTEKIRTKFSGYVLEYPCTVRSSGTISTYFDEQGNSYSDYVLYLGVTLNEDGSIWKLEYNKHESHKPGFRIILKSNGRVINSPPLIKQRGQLTSAGSVNGLTLYREYGRIVGYLDDIKDASGHPPAISCPASPGASINDVFASIDASDDKLRSSCNAGWALTQDIYLSMPASSIKSKYAFHFKDIYQKVNKGLKETIVSIPHFQN